VSRVLGNRVVFGDHTWTVWSEAPGVGCFWLSRRDDEGKAVFIKVRKYKEEWREVDERDVKD
jgi:hypothetical protein